VRSREELLILVHEATEQSSNLRSGPISRLLSDLKALLRLVRAYASGAYKDVSVDSMVLIVGGILYVVSPFDLIPDVLPGGYLDDAAVLAFVLNQVREELDAFLAWEKGRA